MKPAAYPLCWPEKQERTFSDDRISWQHQNLVVPETAYADLLKEINRIPGVTEVTVSCNIPPAKDGLNWGRSFAVKDHGVAAWFTRNGRELSIACDRFRRTEENMRAITLIIDGRRREERYGTASMIEQAWAAFDTKELPVPVRVRPWFEVLSVLPNSDLELVEASYRILAKRLHPDQGGDPAAFREITEAIEKAREELVP